MDTEENVILFKAEENIAVSCTCNKSKTPNVETPYKPIIIELPDQAGVLYTQIGGDHYKQSDLQPIEVILKWGLNFPLGNVIKYVHRTWFGNDKQKRIEDLKKAQHYLEIEIDRLDGGINDI